MKETSIWVSIIIPVFNRETLVSSAIESALAQTYGLVEVLVVDDGSTDDTYQLLKQYDGKIRIITQPNRGQSAARNRGLVECSGEYVLFLDSDDYLEPFAVELLLAGLKKKEKESLDWGLSYGKMLTCDDRLVPLKQQRPRRYCSGNDVLPSLFFDNFVRTGTYLVRKTVLDQIGGFKEDLAVREDRLLLFLIAARSYFHFIDRYVVRYRRHGGARARNNPSQMFCQGARHLDYFFQEAPSPLPEAVIKAKPKLYGDLYMELFKTAWRNRLWNEAVAYYRAACKHQKRYFFYPKPLFRATFAALRQPKTNGVPPGQTP